MKIIGHRGARGIAPENTLAAFQKAIDCGVDMIETDVRLSKDGQLVIAHDDHYKLPDKQKLVVADTDYEALKQHNDAIVTLDEALSFVNRRVRMMVEVKPGVPVEPVIELIGRYLEKGWQPEDFMFNSAHFEILKALQQAFPQIERIIQGNWSGMRVQYLARKLDTSYILLDQRYLWWGYVYLASRRYKLVTYTYMWWDYDPIDHFKAKRWERFGLWGVVTDYPDRYHLSRNERKALEQQMID